LLAEPARAQTSGLRQGPLSNDATTGNERSKEDWDAYVKSAPVLPSEFAQALRTTGICRQTAHRYQALANVPEAVIADASPAHPNQP